MLGMGSFEKKERKTMSICGLDCCKDCPRLQECGGCEKCQGRPFGKPCLASEWIQTKGMDAYLALKKELVAEVNGLGIPDLHIEDLYLLLGSYVNLAYPLPSGEVKLLDDNTIYLGCQVEKEGDERCYGVIADEGFLLVAEYGCQGKDPVLLLYKQR